MTGARIVGWGSALPEKRVTNNDLAGYLDTNDEWITERTGIKERRIGGTTGELAVEAARKAIAVARLQAEEIDMVILATSTPDQVMPPTAAYVQNALGTTGGAMDVNVACSGFVYALAAAQGLLSTDIARNCVVIGADTLSRITDQQDRTTAVLFADGAGAVVLSASAQSQLLATDLGSDGSTGSILSCAQGGTIAMVGKEVYRQAVLICVESIKKVCQQAGVSPTDINLFVAHQANVRIINAVMDRLGMDQSRAAIVLDRTGNTSAASIPLALDDAISAQRVAEDDLVLMCGFGAGMTWATQLWRWKPEQSLGAKQ